MTIRNLEYLFKPKSIAVIGASDTPHSVGATVMRNLLQGGFSGPITPVNPKYRKVAGVRAFPSVARLIRYCRARGIGELFGEVLSGNERMLALAEDLGFEIHHRPARRLSGSALSCSRTKTLSKQTASDWRF